MAYCRIVFPLLVLSVVQSYAAVQVPVYMWGDLAKTTLKSNPLKEVTFNEFNVALKHELENDPFTVIFIEETLSVEDFSIKNEDGDTSYPYLHSNIGDSLYLPSVESPLRVLNKLADPDKVDHVKLTETGLSAEIEPESGKFLFINLKDAKEGETRADFLRRHNDFMEDMFTKLQERYDSVVAVYTAHYPSWTIPESHLRVRRQVQTRPLYRSDIEVAGLRLYYKDIFLNDEALPNGGNGESVLNATAGEMNSTFTFGTYKVTMHFLSKGGYWSFDEVTLVQDNPAINEVLKGKSELYALIGFAYRCAENVSFSTVNESNAYTLVFQDLKVQPFFNTNTTGNTFGDTFNCSGFFSAPIWAGLFVVFILLAITFYGIMMMMDIRTMDRFDDPKGKTITINAGE